MQIIVIIHIVYILTCYFLGKDTSLVLIGLIIGTEVQKGGEEVSF